MAMPGIAAITACTSCVSADLSQAACAAAAVIGAAIRPMTARMAIRSRTTVQTIGGEPLTVT